MKGVSMDRKKMDFWVYFARFYSGWLNAGMLLAIGRILTLHSGNLTRISIYIINQEWGKILFPLAATVSYFIGAFFTHAYYAGYPEVLTWKYWHGYFFVGILFIILWIIPIGSLSFVVILSLGMAVICSMPLNNRGHKGVMTRMTGLITTLAESLSHWVIYKSIDHKEQTIYLANNLLVYILGAMVQTLHYMQVGIVKAWPLMLQAFFLAFWSYRYGVGKESLREREEARESTEEQI